MDRDKPIVLANGLLFLDYDYLPQEMKSRLYFLTDREEALRRTGTPGFYGYYKLRKWFPIRSHLADCREFTAKHRQYYVISIYDHPLEWLLQKLQSTDTPLLFRGDLPTPYGWAMVTEVSGNR